MVTEAFGYSVNVFIPSGQTKGLWLIEKSNWSGVGLKFPRDDFNSIKTRDEFNRPGVYILWGSGESDDPNSPQVYIGEADSLAVRLSQHLTTDDQPFWQQTMVFTSKDVNINKVHAMYLESQLVQIARKANRCNLANKNNPNKPAMADKDSSYALEFLAAMRLCLPIAGIPFFDELPLASSNPGSLSENSILHLSGANSGTTSGVSANGYINGAEFVVLAGAKAAKTELPSVPDGIRANRNKLISDGHFMDKEHYYELKWDYPFSSPSTASSVLLGRNSNGRDVWKTSNGHSINDLAKMPSRD